ncbi:MAG: TIGR03067 domain-containing protein [Bacteroidetes bacterium]|nr:TIGR03067 domain-containing protein [Bacteroidota bacterium]
MRSLSIILISIITAFTGTKYLNPLNGTWVPVKQEINGTPLPESSFQKQSLVITDTSYIFTAESVDKGVAKFGDGKLDIYGKEGVNAGKHFTAIYKLENEMLSICYNLAGNGYPENFDTKGKQGLFLCVFKKDSPK